jgi:hypothetical protein
VDIALRHVTKSSLVEVYGRFGNRKCWLSILLGRGENCASRLQSSACCFINLIFETAEGGSKLPETSVSFAKFAACSLNQDRDCEDFHLGGYNGK